MLSFEESRSHQEQYTPATTTTTSHQDASEELYNRSLERDFALERDGAKVIAFNKEAKKVGALLDDDSDTFLKNECKADKWVIIELSEVTKVFKIELAQHELYSSRVKDFEVFGRQTHPRVEGTDPYKWSNSTQWKLVGIFKAENAKGTQSFLVEPPRWAGYLLLRFRTQHGSEPVCALNGISVFGKSAAEELEDQLATEEIRLDGPDMIKNDSPRLDEELEGEKFEKAGDSTETDNKPEQQIGKAEEAMESVVQNSTPTAAHPTDGPTIIEEALPNENPDAALPPGNQTVSKDHQQVLPAAAIPSADVVEDLQDMPLSIRTGKAKAGSAVYDWLVQEIKGTKLQQRLQTRVLEVLQRNLTLLSEQLSQNTETFGGSLDASLLDSHVAAIVSKHMEELRDDLHKLRVGLRGAGKREQAGLALLGAVGGTLALNYLQTVQKPSLRVLLAAITIGNGVLAVILHVQAAVFNSIYY